MKQIKKITITTLLYGTVSIACTNNRLSKQMNVNTPVPAVNTTPIPPAVNTVLFNHSSLSTMPSIPAFCNNQSNPNPIVSFLANSTDPKLKFLWHDLLQDRYESADADTKQAYHEQILNQGTFSGGGYEFNRETDQEYENSYTFFLEQLCKNKVYKDC